jgi:hypothetical protein
MSRHREKASLLARDQKSTATSSKAKINKNCLFCRRFKQCKDPNKNWRYVCDRFRKIRDEQNELTEKFAKLNIITVKHTESEATEVGVDFQKLIDKALAAESRSPLPPDMRIDDGDIKLAPNFFTFATGKEFLNIKPYPKQVEAGIHLFAEYCPNCSDPDYIWDIPKRADYGDILERVQLLEYGVCPKCKARKSELRHSEKLKVPVELAGLAGQRSGKSAASVMYATYTLHGYLKLQNASKAFDLLDTDTLDGTFVSQTWEKAKNKLYTPLYNYLTTKPWFKQYHQLLDHYGEKYGERLYRINDIFVNYRVRNLGIRPAGPDKRKLRGDTSFVAIIDELGWFDSSDGSEKKIKQSASEIYTALRNSFRTLRSAYYGMLKNGYDSFPAPMFCNISSPSSKRDQMVKNYERSQRSQNMHGFHYSSWEFNPTLNKRDFDDEFNDDPLKAWRDFGAVPPNSSSPYIAEMDDLRGIVDKNMRNTVETTQRMTVSGSGREMRTGKLRFRQRDQNKRIMAIDAGYSGNSFALVAGYRDMDTNQPVFDTLVEIQPTPEYKLNHNSIYNEVIVPMIEKLNIKMIVSDRWQNIKILQDAEAEFGIEIEQYSVKYGDFEAARQDTYDSMITVPKPEIKSKAIQQAGEGDYPHSFAKAPIAHLLFQFLTVIDLGKSVEKGDGTTDDLLRALVLLYSFLTDEDYAQLCMGKAGQISNNPFIGVVASRGGGGGGSGVGQGGVLTGSNGPIGLVSSMGKG